MKEIIKKYIGAILVLLLTIVNVSGALKIPWVLVFLPICGPAILVFLFYVLAKIFNKKR